MQNAVVVIYYKTLLLRNDIFVVFSEFWAAFVIVVVCKNISDALSAVSLKHPNSQSISCRIFLFYISLHNQLALGMHIFTYVRKMHYESIPYSLQNWKMFQLTPQTNLHTNESKYGIFFVSLQILGEHAWLISHIGGEMRIVYQPANISPLFT